MRKILSASVFALALSSMPVALSAQSAETMQTPEATMPDTTAPTMQQTPDASAATGTSPYSVRPEEQSQMDAWPAEQKSRYTAWPSAQQEYFWSLDEAQQKGWWALTDEQRGQVYAMTPDQRAQVWPSILAQVSGQTAATMGNQAQPNPGSSSTQMADSTMPSAAGATASMSADAATGADANAGMGATGGAMASNSAKDYPLCSKTVQDSCRNRGGV